MESDFRLFINSIANQTLSRKDMVEIERLYAPVLGQVVVEITEEEKQNDVLVMLKREYPKNGELQLRSTISVRAITAKPCCCISRPNM